VERGEVSEVTLPLNKEMLAAAYDYLRTTPPFSKWNLPESEDVRFIVTRATDRYAHYRWNGKQHTISVSSAAVAFTATLFEKLSHEMIHLHLEENDMESRGTPNTHNVAFRKFAARVCKHHGFDPKAFY
jgi:hypothetical protein